MKPKDYPKAMLNVLVNAYESDLDHTARKMGVPLRDIAVGLGLVRESKGKVIEVPNWTQEIWPALDEMAKRGWVEVIKEDGVRVKPTPAGLDLGRTFSRPWWSNVFVVLLKVPKVIKWLAAFLASVLAIGKFFGFV